MKNASYNILASFGPNQYVLTGEGYKDASRNDALDLLSQDTALNEFHNTEAADLIRHGWKGYHEVTLTVVEYTVDAEDEVHTRYVAEKTITVDTTEGA